MEVHGERIWKRNKGKLLDIRQFIDRIQVPASFSLVNHKNELFQFRQSRKAPIENRWTNMSKPKNQVNSRNEEILSNNTSVIACDTQYK